MTSPPFSDTPANFLVAGGIGSGKSIALRLLMQSALSLIGLGYDHHALVCDAMGALGIEKQRGQAEARRIQACTVPQIC
jgi:dephospho-CoA kinase